MKLSASWTIGGDFIVSDEDEDAPVATLTLYEPFKSLAIDDAQGIAEAILEAVKQTPHPYAGENDAD